MVPVTIGVPVFNGGELLDECLACLARQTFRDFNVLIFDNASTDATPEIAAKWAARDSRFSHVRQAVNVGGLRNFASAVDAARSPWFLWRADDDLSDDDYLEKLYRLATSAPGCRLAVPAVLSQDLDGGRRRLFPPPAVADPTSSLGRIRMLFGSHPSWVYGLWDNKTIQSLYSSVRAHYAIAYAADHLMLYGPIIDGAVRATSETRFIQRLQRTAAKPRRQTRMSYALMVEIRREVRSELRRLRSERALTLSPQFLATLAVLEPLYLQGVLPKLQKMARTRVREWLGVAAKPVPLGHHFERNSDADPVRPAVDDQASQSEMEDR